ncbi:hypothetical protein BKG82_27710 [Mycobacteroides chelonae]|uniref:PPE family domain-containing protein n=2 Tax=Mycobacteroides chelonae TaxID=1774 RepID=A0A1S1LI62_MYCCH|nr:hypothetical protein BKG82_27710 [Mycobacteroides chelonae]
MAEQMSGLEGDHTSDGERHFNVAGWLKMAARNIADTKTAMNSVASKYHDDYAQAQDDAYNDAWPQYKLKQVKDSLVSNAQNAIASLRQTYETNHTRLATEIGNGDTAPPISDMQSGLQPGADSLPPMSGVQSGIGRGVDVPTPDGPARTYPMDSHTDPVAPSQVNVDVGEANSSGLAPNGVGKISDFQRGGGLNGPYDTDAPAGPAQVRPPEIPGVGRDAPIVSEPAAVRPAGLASHVDPIDPSAGDYERLYPKLFPNPFPGQPGGGTWADVAPSAGDATHPPHGGLIPNIQPPGYPQSQPPEYTQVEPNGRGGYDIVAPGTNPADRNRTDGANGHR